jgi:hypothetical protein
MSGPLRGTGPARRACGLSGPTRRASQNRAQEAGDTKTTAAASQARWGQEGSQRQPLLSSQVIA